MYVCILALRSISYGNVCVVFAWCHRAWNVTLCSLNVKYIDVYVCMYVMRTYCSTVFCKIFVFNFPFVCFFFGCSWSFQQEIVFYWNTDASNFFFFLFFFSRHQGRKHSKHHKKEKVWGRIWREKNRIFWMNPVHIYSAMFWAYVYIAWTLACIR